MDGRVSGDLLHEHNEASIVQCSVGLLTLLVQGKREDLLALACPMSIPCGVMATILASHGMLSQIEQVIDEGKSHVVMHQHDGLRMQWLLWFGVVFLGERNSGNRTSRDGD